MGDVSNFRMGGQNIPVKDVTARERIGDLEELNTTAKDNLVDAINEIGSGGGVENYTDLTNKPSINGVELVGNKTTSDLNIETGEVDYEALENKPSINNVSLVGDVSSANLNIDYDDLVDRPVESGNIDMESIVDPLPPIATEEKVLVDERGTEYTVGWYVNSSGKRKPVYRKTLSINSVTKTSWNNIGMVSSDIDKVVEQSGILVITNENGENAECHKIGGYRDNTVYTEMYVYKNNNKCYVYVGDFTNSLAQSITVTIQYTKTTDEWEDIPT